MCVEGGSMCAKAGKGSRPMLDRIEEEDMAEKVPEASRRVFAAGVLLFSKGLLLFLWRTVLKAISNNCPIIEMMVPGRS